MESCVGVTHTYWITITPNAKNRFLKKTNLFYSFKFLAYLNM